MRFLLVVILFLLAGCSDYSSVDNYINSIEEKHNASMVKFGTVTKEQRILDAYAYYKDRGFFKDSEISDKNIVNKVLLTNDFNEHFDPFSTDEGNYYFTYGDLYKAEQTK
ncbi:hypothetical protein [Paenibacillus sp. JDR-2]|uniref:hypothetical protein n=1 Tax=Paenibacillus sp. (strain JDR-2) TaxID=324057 RepID=UPI0001667CA9|nr:hypothetical protein [Paenibacillus sp. JDR-2]ACT01356.1 hypothetical protein Pjdr2_2703 [Paenibacillus sp. JDR-2]